MVLVLMGGEILQRFMTLPEAVTQEQLSSSAGKTNQCVHGQVLQRDAL